MSPSRVRGMATADATTPTLTNCEGEPLDKRRVQCRRVLGVIEGFIESPRSSNQRSSFDLHDTIIPARLENLAVQSRWTKDATDSVTLFS